jgi:selenide,water dikinase
MTNHWVDIKNADVVLIMGGNAAEAHPCGFKWVTEAKAHNKAKLIVVDPRFTRSASVADYYAPIRPQETIRDILRGGEAVCESAGIPIAGGHSIDSVEPIYGLAVIGMVEPRYVKRNSGARTGDALILGKPLGVGILSAALKKNALDESGYRAMIETTTQLNLPGIELSRLSGVHAMTDVTGFGLFGHLLEMCRGSGLGARITAARVPMLAGVWELAQSGVVTGASARNWQSFGADVRLASHLDAAVQSLLTDPQTSGGLLVACEPGEAPNVLSIFSRLGFAHAGIIGETTSGGPHVLVE